MVKGRGGDVREKVLITGIIGMLVMLGAGALFTLRRLSVDQQRIVSIYERALDDAVDAEHLVATSERAARLVRSYLVAPEAEPLEQLTAARHEFSVTLQRLKSVHGATGFRGHLEAIERAQVRVQKSADALITARREGAAFESVGRRFEQELIPARRELDGAISTMGQTMRAAVRADRERAQLLLQADLRLFAGSLGAALLLLLGMMGLLALLVQRNIQREQQLRVSEAKFSGIVSLAADAIISVDEQRRIVIFNKGAEAIFGFQATEVLGQTLELLLPERLRTDHAGHVHAFSAGPSTARHMGERKEILGRRKSGEEFPAEAAISKLDVNGGSVMTAVLRDISERRRAEREQRFLSSASAALAESLDVQVTLDRIARLVVPELADGCIIHLLEKDTLVIAAVAHVEAASAQALREALERNPIAVHSRHVIAQAVRTGRPQLQAHHPEAQLCVPLCMRGACIGAISLSMGPSGRTLDDRDLRLAEELARRASLAMDNARLYAEALSATRSRDEMLGIVAHDLRSPVNAMTLAASAVLRKLKKQGADAEQLQNVESVIQSARRMNRLIEDLLDVVRMEVGKLSIQRSRWPAAQLVQDAVLAHQALCAEAGIELRQQLPEGLPELVVDPDRILQVFTNLMGNAIKFTPRGGVVTVGASLEPGQVVFCISDTGPGIPEEHLPHLFDRFWQARSTDRRGAGLGLAIAKGIVEAHGGRLWVRSALGQGSTFSFCVPLPPPAP
jgi:PAS domain S-box-containing protein